jgi:hypothetical protein
MDQFTDEPHVLKGQSPSISNRLPGHLDEWSVPLKNWTGNKLDLEPHFRHLIGKGGTP